MPKITFLGGAGTVTGSKYLLSHGGRRILIDCGLFQGLKQLRLRNWAPFPVPPGSIEAVILTHAHLDHSGYLPALIRDGFKGPVYASDGTKDVCGIILPDSGMLQERDAEFANKHRFSKHEPALPLYTAEDAMRALEMIEALPFNKRREIGPDTAIILQRGGHILGASIVQCEFQGRKIVFSGDLGQFGDPVMVDPTLIEAADYLVVESTYGNRKHDTLDPQEALLRVVKQTVEHGGTVVVPAFAVGRAQSLLWHLDRLRKAGRLGNVPVFLDSPMATDATELLAKHPNDHRLSAAECRAAFSIARVVRSPEESKALTADPMPKIIISASGMATGGRVLHHIKHYVGDRNSTILFSGFQAAGTRGAAMLAGAESVKIHGVYYPVRARVENLSMLSAHADADGLLRWLKGFKSAPRQTFITHGEPTASDALRHRIEEELGWNCTVPEQMQRVTLA
ncbi:MBL fold metallo-hydrolase [Dongia rigui]|uniref:MBL fold metallo-hydrolase n=1 Tax=Dongia rigui TaxID=940149 RepID=A0ABU5DUI1_9PROT|nr:MBL fold metallo-hydrolase [Dongia rigui]MDY0870971.1 MBL fold metallo-hydrolase [Dongia rigui]